MGVRYRGEIIMIETLSNVDSQEEDRGLRCRKCRCRQFRVIYTRAARGSKLVRRRECNRCKARITTWEQIIGGG
jgi:hypothetical protein